MSNIIGICDFKISEEVYLSLLMIDANQQGKGLGSIVYNQLEKLFKDCMSNIIGICDFKISEEVYLSLLMIDANQQGKGLGSIVYNQLEKLFKENHSNKVRIDVVYNYDHNAVDFWEKQGFIPCEKI